MSKMMDAFIQQTYGSAEKMQEAMKQADLNPYAKGNEHLAKDIDDKFQKELLSKHFLNEPIKESMSIPSKLNDSELNQKTEVHPNFKNYDHSLEKERKIGLIYLAEPTKEDSLEDMPDLEVGSLSDMLGSIED